MRKRPAATPLEDSGAVSVSTAARQGEEGHTEAASEPAGSSAQSAPSSLEATPAVRSATSVATLSYKVQKRVRQRLPGLPFGASGGASAARSFVPVAAASPIEASSSHSAAAASPSVRSLLHGELSHSGHWFPAVNAALLQNPLLQALGATAHMGQPAEHFFTTAWRTFDRARAAEAGRSSEPGPAPTAAVEGFLAALRRELGASWNARLEEPARLFYATAHDIASRPSCLSDRLQG